MAFKGLFQLKWLLGFYDFSSSNIHCWAFVTWAHARGDSYFIPQMEILLQDDLRTKYILPKWEWNTKRQPLQLHLWVELEDSPC